ncbi:phage tail protein, partial [Achromobacter sp. Marseille-Q0513]|nr:phage tail protein [Achromobacter sp. Marseille-Q0513]
MHKHITVYQTDRDGLYLYETVAHEFELDEGVYNVPYGAFTDAPPSVPAGRIARRVGDAWQTVEDHRATPLWVRTTKAP